MTEVRVEFKYRKANGDVSAWQKMWLETDDLDGYKLESYVTRFRVTGVRGRGDND